MKISLKILLFALFVTTNVFAQRQDKAKIKALKIAHITEQLDLTKTEAQKFWPIYNANEEAENKLRVQSSIRRKSKKPENLTEGEAKSLLMDMQNIEKQRMELKSKLLSDLLEVIPAKKIIKLLQSERSFRQKMFEEYKKRHRGDRP